MDIVSRIKNIITTPQTEWAVISSEPTDPPTLYTSYIIPLAAIPPVATFLGLLIFGVGGFRFPIGTLIVSLIVSYILALVMVGVLGFIFAKLAPSFGGQDDVNQGLKLAAYSMTASWIAGIFAIIPFLGLLALIGGLYSLYLLYLGVPVLMKNPQEKTLVYVITAIVIAIVLFLIVGFIQTRVFLFV
jgi:hypothetical protein